MCGNVEANKERMKQIFDKIVHFPVPDTSYSSSEGEDDFYDANDDPFASQLTTPTRWVEFTWVTLLIGWLLFYYVGTFMISG